MGDSRPDTGSEPKTCADETCNDTATFPVTDGERTLWACEGHVDSYLGQGFWLRRRGLPEAVRVVEQQPGTEHLEDERSLDFVHDLAWRLNRNGLEAEAAIEEALELYYVRKPEQQHGTEGRHPTAWILWGRRVGTRAPLPLGAYVSREIAIAAEEAAQSHENAAAFDDVWVSPWPLRNEPTLNFRVSMPPASPEHQPDDAPPVYGCLTDGCSERLRGTCDEPTFCSVCQQPLSPLSAHDEDLVTYSAKVRELEAALETERGRTVAAVVEELRTLPGFWRTARAANHFESHPVFGPALRAARDETGGQDG